MLQSCTAPRGAHRAEQLEQGRSAGLGGEDVEVEGKGMVDRTKDPRFIYDLYRRLVQMFGSVVLNVPDEVFEEVITGQREKYGAKSDAELPAEAWKSTTQHFKEIVRTESRPRRLFGTFLGVLRDPPSVRCKRLWQNEVFKSTIEKIEKKATGFVGGLIQVD